MRVRTLVLGILIPLSVVTVFFWGSAYGSYASGTVWGKYLVPMGYITFAIMLFEEFRANENTALTICTFHLKFELPPGAYPLPCFFPFLRGFGLLAFGFGKDVHESRRPSKIRRSAGHDQSIPSYGVLVKTMSFFAADSNRLMNRILHELTTFTDWNGELEYWRISRALFVFFLWPGAFIGNHVAPTDPNQHIINRTLDWLGYGLHQIGIWLGG